MNTPASPTQRLYGLYDFVLVTGFLATIVCFSFRLRQLDASTGTSGPHDFTVRLWPRSSVAAFASIASHRTVVTIAIAPLVAVDGQD